MLCGYSKPYYLQVQGDNDSQLDLGAVQRGDAEMEQKMNRIIRACIEGDNPILSIHDQGAGGNGEMILNMCASVFCRLSRKLSKYSIVYYWHVFLSIEENLGVYNVISKHCDIIS